MSRIIYLSRYPISPEGDGGYHRTYQLYYELCQAFGKAQVDVLPLDSSVLSGNSDSQKTPTSGYLQEVRDRAKLLIEMVKRQASPFYVFQYLSKDAFPTLGSNHVVPRLYKEYLSGYGTPDVCLVEDPSFGDVLSINQEMGIRTIFCFQNIEAGDRNIGRIHNPDRLSIFLLNLSNELRLIQESSASLTISKSEASFLGGLGLMVSYHPYLPVGEIYEYYCRIRRNRRRSVIDPNLFLLIGTSNHQPTGDGMKWFLGQAERNGLPENARILVCGKGTESFQHFENNVSGVTVKGWISQAELEEILSRVNAVLIPQMTGFGALTKVSEFACAGIPILVSAHPSYAIDLPLRVTVVQNEWCAWKEEMQVLMVSPFFEDDSTFDTWATKQPKTLVSVVNRLL